MDSGNRPGDHAERERPGDPEQAASRDLQSEDARPPDEGLVERLSSQLREAENRHLRAAADLENVKRRARQELLENVRYAAARIAEQLLPVLDDAERAVESMPEGINESWSRGVRMVVQKLREALSSAGVEPIDAVGARFDPRLHEAVGSEESSEHPEGTVVRELRRGYRIHDRVLRPALVKLARRPVAEDSRRPVADE